VGLKGHIPPAYFGLTAEQPKSVPQQQTTHN
jgi:hypothetical protein